MNTKYMAKLANLIFTNRYFEFVQSDDFLQLEVVAKTKDPPSREPKNEQIVHGGREKRRGESSKMISAFDQLKNRTLFSNKAYNSDKFREM